jgi:hypothetical protein
MDEQFAAGQPAGRGLLQSSVEFEWSSSFIDQSPRWCQRLDVRPANQVYRE